MSPGGTPARKNGLGLGNAALPALDSGNGGGAEVEEALAELWLAGLARDGEESSGEAADSLWSSPRKKRRGERALGRK